MQIQVFYKQQNWIARVVFTILSLLLFHISGNAQALTGTKTIPGTYSSLSAAIADLNTNGVGNGGVVFNITSGYTETLTAPLSVTATGTFANTITFQKSGSGSNPVITSYINGAGTPASATIDGIWTLVGCDYITIDGINLIENTANTINPATMEYGFGLFKASGNNGCQNITIKNSTITLNRINNASGTAPMVDGSVGILSINAIPSAATTTLTVASSAGTNSNNKFYTNTIQNCNIGIALIGYADAAPFLLADQNNDIGGAALSTGNTIKNYGGGGITSPAAAVRTLAQYGLNVSYNTINNNDGGGINHGTTLRGIYLNTAVSASETISYNTITLNSAVTTSQVSVIENVAGATALNNTVSINNNTIQNCTNATTTTGTWYGIYTTAAATNLNVTNNTFTNNTTASTSGASYYIYNSGAVAGTINLNNNNIAHSNIGATAPSATIYSIYNGSGTTATVLNINNNTFSNYSFTNTNTGTTYFIYNINSSFNSTFNANNFNNLSINSSGALYLIYNSSSTQSALTVTNNTITTGFTRTAAAGTMYCYYAGSSSLPNSTQIFSGNNFSNITATTSGTGTFYGIYTSDGATSPYPRKQFFNNTLSNINYNTTGTFYGMYTSYLGESGGIGSSIYNNNLNTITTSGALYPIYTTATASPNMAVNIYGNNVNTITTSGASSTVNGIYIAAAAPGTNVYQNKIYNIQATGITAGVAYGMNLISAANYNVYNNLISDIKNPNTSATNSTIGLNINTGSTVNVYHNTIFLSATTTAANFGSSAVYASTTPTVNLRNNIIINNSTPSGTGLSVAYRRSSTTLTTYGATSNNNIFYAGTPSASNLIYHDGTNSDQTLTAYQTRFTPRDAASYTENTSFISNIGTNINFLKPDTTLASAVEATGGITGLVINDYTSNPRPGNLTYNGNAGLPDIGAYEANFTSNAAVNMVSDSSNADQITGIVPTGSTNKQILRIRVYGRNGLNALNISSFKFSTSGSTNPSLDVSSARLYYTGNNATFATTNQYGNSVGTPNGTFYINGNRKLIGDVNYFWLVYDISNTATPLNNVDATLDSIVIGGSNYALINNNPAGNRQIMGRLAGNYNVGSGGAYTSINAAISDLNLLGVSAPVTFTLTDVLYNLATTNITALPITVNAYENASPTNTVTIIPASGISVAITETSANPIFNLSGVNYFRIDGRQGGNGLAKSLTIINNNTAGSAVNFINDASRNKLVYAVFRASSTTATTGVINFNTGLVNGNDSNLIDYCDIGDGTTTPATGIQASGSTDGTLLKYNDYNVISNCNIFNFWHASAESNGFKISNGNNYWTITGNSIYQTSARSGSSGYYTFNFQNSSNNNALNGLVVTNNYIGGSAPQCGGTPWTQTSSATNQNTYFNLGNLATSTFSKNVMANYNFTTTSTSAAGAGVLSFAQYINGRLNIDSNTIGSITDSNSIVITGGSASSFVPIYSSASNTAGTYSISGNKFGGIKLSGGAAVANSITLITVASAVATQTFNIDNNIIGGNFANSIIASTSSAAQNVIGIAVTSGTANIRMRNNIIRNLTNMTTGSGSISGINVTNTATIDTITGNTISNFINGGATQTNNDGSASIIGIQCISTGAGNLISQNNVLGLYNVNNGASLVTINGINVNNMTSSLVTRNLIHSLSVLGTGTGSSINGVNFVGGTIRLTNNMIRLGIDTAGAPLINTPIINGINKKAGNLEGYFNTVYIGGDNIGTGTAQTFAFNRGTAGADVIQNNVFVNYRNNATTGGGHYVVGLTNTTTLTLNYNVYHSQGNYDSVGIVAGIPALTMANWRSASGQDGNTGFSPASLINPIGSNNNIDLHVSGTTPIEAAGTAITGFGTDVDFDGQTRLSLTPVDIGADAGNYTPADIVAPGITTTPLVNTPLTGDRTVTATITDVTGTYLTGANRPRIYFKKMAIGIYTSNVGILLSGNKTNSTWSFTISASALGGLTGNDSVYYYIIAQDSTPTNNTGSMPAGVEATNVNTVINHPALPFGYKITPVISGNFNVGAGQTFTTLTGTNGMFTYINTAVVGGNITINITSDIEEPGTIALNETIEQGIGNYKINIVPDAATLRSLTGTVSTSNSAVIRLDGADRVKIDGSYAGSGRYIRIMNRVQGAATLNLLNDADNDTIANVIIEGVNNTVGMLNFFSSTKVGGTGNDSNVVIGCMFRDTLGTIASGNIPNTGLFSQGALSNDYNQIINNEIYNFGYNGINLSTTSGDFWTITGNKFYQITTKNNAMVIAQINGGTGHNISNNSFGGAAADRSGTAFQTTSSLSAIVLSSSIGTASPFTISNNTFSNMASTGTTTALKCITVAAGTVTIANNICGGGVMPYDTLRNAGDGNIIELTGGTATVSNNTLSDYRYYAGSTVYRHIGIYVSSGTHTIINNTIKRIEGNNAATALGLYVINGIYLNGGTNHIVRGNTISDIKNFNTGTGAYFAAGMMVVSATSSTIEKNRIYRISALGTGTGTSAPTVIGIYTSSAGHNYYHNQISLGDNTTGETVVSGARNVTTAGISNYIGNSIFINGNTAAGANNSFGIERTSTGTVNATNNLIYNKRTTGGTGKNYPLGSTNAITSANLNYNLLVSSDTATLALLGGFTQRWSDLNTIYATYNTNWAESVSNIPAEQLFIDTAVGNLSIVTSSPAAWYANGKGIAVSGLAGDFNNTTVRSTSIATGAVDIGSVEFTPTVAPPAAYADKIPATGDSTSFYFASRQVAKLVWGNTGTVPSAVNALYYSGTNPANTASGKTFMNSYINITPAGGSGYSVNLTMMYDSATMGSVVNKNNLILARYIGTGTTWTGYLTSSVNNAGFVSTANVNLALGIFTGTDATSNPLPVELLSLSAEASAKHAILNWVTATEVNSKGFELERSIDGKQFEYVTFVKSAGNSHVKNSYNYTDVNALNLNKTIYYRLKMVDMDGEFEYSTVVKVNANTLTEDVIAVYPNPYNNNCNVSITGAKDGAATIEVYDLQGRKMLDQTTTITNGTTIVNINESNSLNAGVYMVRIIANGNVSVIKVMKQ
jgi:hypothetical protein